jgi:signal peptide peptidase-like protein 3
MEQEAREKEKKRQSESTNNLLTGEPVQQDQSKNFHFIYTMYFIG